MQKHKGSRKGQRVTHTPPEAPDLRGNSVAKISVHLRQQSIHLQTVTKKLQIIKIIMKIKTGTVVVKVKREMYVMSVWKKWKDKGESLLSDFTFKQGAANCSL